MPNYDVPFAEPRVYWHDDQLNGDVVCVLRIPRIWMITARLARVQIIWWLLKFAKMVMR